MTAKSIFRSIGICLLLLAFSCLWFVACASGGTSTGSAADTAKKAGGDAKTKTGERGLAVVELPQIAADIEVFPQLGHSISINSVKFSPDGKYILSGGEEGIKLWETETGKEIRTINGGSRAVFSPDGKYILGATLKLWDAATGREIRKYPGYASSITFSPDGKQILVGDSDGAKLIDVDTGKIIRTFTGNTDPVMSVAFSPDGKLILSGSGTNSNRKLNNYDIKLWDATTGREIRTFSGHSDSIISIEFSPDGKWIISGSYDRTLKLWDTTTGIEIRTFSGHTEKVTSVAFSPDGKRVISGSYDRNLKLWDTFTGMVIRNILSDNRDGDRKVIFSVAFSPDGSFILSGTWGREINLWDAETGMKIRTFTGYTDTINSVAFTPSGNILSNAKDSSGYGVRFWDTTTGREIKTFSGRHRTRINTIKISPDGKQILTGAWDGTLKLWDAETGREIINFPKHNDGVNSVAFSPDGRNIISGSQDRTLKLWDTETGKEIKVFSRNEAIFITAFSPDGKQILSESSDAVRLWDVATGREIRTFTKKDRYSAIAAFNPDGKSIIVGNGLTFILLDISTGQTIKNFGAILSSVQSVAFNIDGKQILSGYYDGTIKLWNTETGKEIKTFTGHSGLVFSVAFSHDGRYILSGSRDGTVRLWNASTGKEIVSFITFTGDDSQLASASRGLIVETQTASSTIDGEWLSITPDGYYQASPRGDRYLNVRVNNTVSGIDSYRSIFYNPDVVQARLQGKPDPKSKVNVTIQQAAAFIPPEVAIQSPANFSTTNTATTVLSVNISSQSQPVKNIKIIVNGRLIGKDELATVKGTGLQPQKASLTVTGNQKTVNLTLPLELDLGNNRIEVVAFNGYSESRRFIDVTRNAPAGEKPPLPNLWIVAVGVNGYDNAGTKLQGLTSLNFAVADAKGLVDSLKAQEGKRYAKVNSMLIADGEAASPTTANIRQGLKFLEGADPRRDIVILFLAGHGISAQESKFFFLPKDAIFNGDRIVDANRAISGDEIMTVLDAPGNRLVFIDACQSGGVDNDRMVRSLMDTNAFVFTASRGNELSYESRELGHGFFTYSVMSALKGAPAALAQGNVSVLSMSGFVKDDVPKKTGGRQNPSAYSLGFYDFPVAVIK